MPLAISSSAFGPGEEIPRRYTCEGEDISPPLAWADPPDGTKSLAFVIDDPDAPDPANPRMTWVHWVLFNIPPTATALPEAIKPDALPAGTVQGLNDWKRPGYGGPCPPKGRHRYFHKLYALDTILSGLGTAAKADLEKAMRGHILAEAQLIGTYEKSSA